VVLSVALDRISGLVPLQSMETVTKGHHSDNLQSLAQLTSPDKLLVPSSCQKNLNLKCMQFLYQPELLMHMQSALRSKKQQEDLRGNRIHCFEKWINAAANRRDV